MKPQSILERMLLENGFKYSVYNLGVSGSQTLNIVNLIINKLGNKPGSTLVDLKVPNGCDKIRFGLRGWKSQQVRVIKASISVVNA